ncbi:MULTISPECIES: hypothetical protein [unclassified Azospirillum]|nr:MULTISPECIES: hypothetical protein [unclassified Azospirillum]
MDEKIDVLGTPMFELNHQRGSTAEAVEPQRRSIRFERIDSAQGAFKK